MKNHSNTVLQKENDDFSKTKLKITEYWYLIDREYKIAVMKKLNKLQENSEQDYFSKEIETLKYI